MATNTQLKFYKLGANASMPTSGLTPGAIYFVPKEGLIRVATSATESEYYGGRLHNAEWDSTKLILTITKLDGSSLKLDFSDMASSKAVTDALNTINGTVESIATAVGLTKDGDNYKFAKNATNYGGTANTIGGEIHNIDEKLKAVVEDVSKMATSDVVEGISQRLGVAENNITALQLATEGYDKDHTVADAIAAAKAEAKTVVSASTDTFSSAHLEVATATDSTDKHVTYTVKVKDLVDSTAYIQDQNDINARFDLLDKVDTGRVSVLEKQVAALNAATHFEGKVEGETFEAAVAGKTFDSGDIVIYGNKEYIFDGAAWIELGDTTAEQGRLTQVENRAKDLEDWKKTIVETTIPGLNDSIGKKLDADTYNTFIDGDYASLSTNVTTLGNRVGNIDGVTGFNSEDVNKASYSDTNYLNSATTLKAADVALDAAIKAVSDRVDTVEGEVAEVVGDNSTIAVNTVDGVATVSALTNTIAEAISDSTVAGLATAADVASALCWVEFGA